MEEKRTKSRVWRIVRLVLGLVLLPLGIVGLFLPFLQGVLFLIASLALLADEIPFLARIRDRIRERYPGPWEKGERLKAWFRAKLGRKACTGDENRSP